LEIDDGGEYGSAAEKLMAIGNRVTDNIHIKHDGSLNEGMEIVTHPMTLTYHREQMPWQEITQKALQLGNYSHCTETCDLHVRVNRNSFVETKEEQEAAIARILYFVENHWNELMRLSRRTKRQLERWTSRYGRKDSPKEYLENETGS